MNASLAWLRDFADLPLTPAAVRDLLTARVATVDDVVPLRADLRDIVVGRVVEAAPHPDSDHLWVTRVDAGGDALLDVVCGAPNVTVGTSYPFAPVGATLPGGLRIERRRIRGAVSSGMLCSARELALGGDHSGILALDTDAAPGTPFLEVVAGGDVRLVVDVLPNRPDLLAHEGIARELAAARGVPLRVPAQLPVPATTPVVRDAQRATAGGTVPVTIEPGAACSTYVAAVIRGVTVGPSPDWLVARLEAVGSRSVNNVVDATNYMLHAFGHPMHAFDLDRVTGGTVVVRLARDGERIRTLDGSERVLDRTVTVIADAARAQAIAGVMGGADSEVTDATRDVLLEVAVFDPGAVRRTRRALGLATDASYRFERGVDRAAAEARARLAAALIVTVAGGEVAPPIAAVGARPEPPVPRALRLARVAAVLGEAPTPGESTRLLASIGFGVQDVPGGTLLVTPPTWRADIVDEVDLIEELARLHGYDAFPATLRAFRASTVPDSPAYAVAARVTGALVAAGLYEARPVPFVDDAGPSGVRLANPLAESEAMLRADLLATLARRVEHNFAHMQRTVRLFEVGVAFRRAADGGSIPEERTLAAAVITGDRYPAHFTDAHPPHVDRWDAKWLAEQIVAASYGAGRGALHPDEHGAGWSVVIDGVPRGRVTELELDAPVWAAPVFGVEVDITPAFRAERPLPRYRGLPATPAAEFDLALLVPDAVPATAVEGVIRRTAGELLEQIEPFDEFRGAGVAPGGRSVAWRLTLRHPERTLRDREIDGRRGRILQALEEELGVRPRAV